MGKVHFTYNGVEACCIMPLNIDYQMTTFAPYVTCKRCKTQMKRNGD